MQAPSRKLKLVLAYDGTDFHGWQIQPGQRTVQGVLQDALGRMTGAPTCTRGASRTDAGVHALGQVATFETQSRIPCEGFARGLSKPLRPDVVVVSAEEVDADFDARRSATGKLYQYDVLVTPRPSPLLRRFTWWQRPELDVAAMREAASAIVGTHDFAAFRAAGASESSTVRTIRRLDLDEEAERLRFRVEGTAFLMHMVRILVGTLVAVGRGRIEPSAVTAILESRDRRRAGPTAPPQGLTLVRVDYDPPRAR